MERRAGTDYRGEGQRTKSNADDLQSHGEVYLERMENEVIDLEKVKKGLRCCMNSTVEDPFHMCQECPYNEVSVAVQDCRALLSAEALQVLNNQPEIVRCKYCKHLNDCVVFDSKWGIGLDWYCADGERR